MAKEVKEMDIRVLRYVSDNLAKFEYAPVDSSGKIKIGNRSWSILQSKPDYIQIKKRGKGYKQEPFFILRNDLASPVKIDIKEQATNPTELNQLIENENLKALTKLDPVEVNKTKMYIFGLVMFVIGIAVMFVMTLVGLF